MKKQAFFALIISLIITACNQNKPVTQIPIVGEAVDSTAIASDTLQEKSMEQSYEYAQTVIVNPKLVYDIRAYGGSASHGEYAILRRDADNKADTVVRAVRSGIIVNAFTADLNKNGKEEIYLVMRKPLPGSPTLVSGFEFDSKGIAKSLDLGNTQSANSVNSIIQYTCDEKFVRSDSVFVRGRSLIKLYYCGGDRTSDATERAWNLKENKFVPSND